MKTPEEIEIQQLTAQRDDAIKLANELYNFANAVQAFSDYPAHELTFLTQLNKLNQCTKTSTSVSTADTNK